MTEGNELDDLTRDAFSRATAFDELIESAIREKHATLPDAMIDQMLNLHRWKAGEFAARYQEGSVFPIERLGELVYQIMDISLQYYYVTEVDLGLQNSFYYGPLQAMGTAGPSPRMSLIKMSLDQSIIGKTRVLWERLMNLVYNLEFGKELDSAKPKSRSKKGFFFKEIREQGGFRWRWLLPYEKVIEDYDSKFRTAEFHKNSVLRSQFIGMKEIGPNDLLTLVNRFINVVWDNLLDIVSGKEPAHFTDLHMTGEHKIDPQYLPSSE
jgi:hypothetical protein